MMIFAVRTCALAAATFAFTAWANAAPSAPYREYSFLVTWDNHTIQNVTAVGPLTRTTQAVLATDSDADTTTKSPGTSDYVSVTLERGLSSDNDFQNWADAVSSFNPARAPGSFRKTVLIDLLDSSRGIVRTWILYRCWPAEYQALPRLSSGDTDEITERLTLVCDRWAPQ